MAVFQTRVLSTAEKSSLLLLLILLAAYGDRLIRNAIKEYFCSVSLVKSFLRRMWYYFPFKKIKMKYLRSYSFIECYEFHLNLYIIKNEYCRELFVQQRSPCVTPILPNSVLRNWTRRYFHYSDLMFNFFGSLALVSRPSNYSLQCLVQSVSSGSLKTDQPMYVWSGRRPSNLMVILHNI